MILYEYVYNVIKDKKRQNKQEKDSLKGTFSMSKIIILTSFHTCFQDGIKGGKQLKKYPPIASFPPLSPQPYFFL